MADATQSSCCTAEYNPHITTTNTTTTMTATTKTETTKTETSTTLTTTTTTDAVHTCEDTWPTDEWVNAWNAYCARREGDVAWAMTKDCAVAWPSTLTEHRS